MSSTFGPPQMQKKSQLQVVNNLYHTDEIWLGFFNVMKQSQETHTQTHKHKHTHTDKHRQTHTHTYKKTHTRTYAHTHTLLTKFPESG